MKMLSLRARLTLWYTLALVVVLCLFGADVLWVQSRIGTRRVDRELDGLTTTLTNVIHGELAEHASLADAAEEARRAVTARGRAIAILDVHGVPLAAGWSWPRAPAPGRSIGGAPGVGLDRRRRRPAAGASTPDSQRFRRRRR